MLDTCGSEDGRCKDGHSCNTNPFLHDLEPDDELHATASVKFTRANAEQHREVR